MSGMIVEEVQRELYGKAAPLVEGRWRDHIEGIREAKPEIDPWNLGVTALCLENVFKWYERNLGTDVGLILEGSTTGNIANFIRHGFDIIAAVMPSLIANEILSVQPLTRRKGEIFYMEYLYGTTKGRINAGDRMFGREVAGNAEIWYSHETVPEEQVIQNGGAPGAGAFAGFSNDALPIRAQSYSLAMAKDGGGTLTATDNGAGVLVGTDVNVGTIDYVTGAVTVTWNSNAAANAWLLSTYRTNFETAPDNIPEVDLQINSESVTALDRKMRCRYTLDFSFDMREEFGLNPESLLSSGLASEIRKEIDGELLEYIRANAEAPAPAIWPVTPPAGVSYAEHKWTFIDAVIEASNNLFAATRRAAGNFIVAGLGVCNVIESLSPRFQRQGRVQPGPHFIGTLDNTWRVYKNPFYANNEYVVGYKGEMWVEAGVVYAPYMPVFMTKPVMLDDFINRKGIATSYAKHKVTGLFYSRGEITT